MRYRECNFPKRQKGLNALEEKNEIIISPKIIFDVIRKNLIFILVTTLVFALGAYFITKFFVPKKYTATVSFYVETLINDDSNVSSSNLLSMHNYAQKLVATYVRMLDTNKCYTELSKALGERYTPGQLNSMISFQNDGTTEVFDVRVVSDTASEAKEIADAFAQTAPTIISDLNSQAELKVADAAQTPGKPSSPNVLNNVVIFGVLGLLLSLVISFVRYFLDKKIKYNEEMTELMGLPVLAAIPNFNTYIDQQQKNQNSKEKNKEGSNG